MLRLRGWPIVGWATLAITIMIAVTLANSGIDEEGVRAVIRATARSSYTLFLIAFISSAFYKVWKTPLSKWMLANRRYVGVSFAVSHMAHLIAVFVLASMTAGTDRQPLNPVSVIGGGLVYLFVIFMAITSFDRTAAWLGDRYWRYLHTTGVYLIWLIFMVSYGARAFQSIAFAPLAILLILAISVRLFTTFSRKPVRSVVGG
jgi:methionine sulfoxide reductase heme-binding subunit